MDIESLNTFLVVSRTKHFGKASGELYISQSSVSKQIKSIEKELNTSLFNRTTRQVELTPAGEELQIYAKDIVQTYFKLKKNMCKYDKSKEVNITFGTMGLTNIYKLPRMISYFKRIYPNINIELVEGNVNYIVKNLKQNNINIALLTTNTPGISKFRKYPLIFDEVCIAVPKSHYLDEKNIIYLSDLYDEKFIFVDKSDMYNIIMEYSIKYKIYLNINCKNTKLETVLSLVENKLGITVVSKKVAVHLKNYDLKFINIHNSPLITSVVALSNETSKETELFKDFLLEWFLSL